MEEVSAVVALCESCNEETPHRVIKGRFGTGKEPGFEGTVECTRCKGVHRVRLPLARPLEVPAIISDGDRSERTKMELHPMELVSVGDELQWDGHNLQVTSIESKGRRLARSNAALIDTLWLKRFDSLRVKVSIVRGQNTASEVVIAPPDEEFEVGDILELGKAKVMIDKIRTDEGTVYRTGLPVEARYIKRVYSKPVRERTY